MRENKRRRLPPPDSNRDTAHFPPITTRNGLLQNFERLTSSAAFASLFLSKCAKLAGRSSLFGSDVDPPARERERRKKNQQKTRQMKTKKNSKMKRGEKRTSTAITANNALIVVQRRATTLCRLV